ncbi:MAG: hypothetical protein Ct9H300mP1_39480 [Planctomycetaceae bacterium]|nr:MAG: hypothetical protein Ct9H300mP1_39480 [Planctomycetaceae bacterium]
MELTARTVRIDSIRILGWSLQKLDVEIVCGSGTYIRSVGRALGNRLGCGAVMSGLVRTRVGPFLLDGATPVESLDPETVSGRMVSSLVAVAELPRQIATLANWERSFPGRRVAWSGATPEDGARVVLVDSESQLAAVGEIRGPTPRSFLPPGMSSSTTRPYRRSDADRVTCRRTEACHPDGAD